MAADLHRTVARPEPDGERLLADLDQLAGIGAQPGGGVSRVAYSAADVEARDWVGATWLASAPRCAATRR